MLFHFRYMRNWKDSRYSVGPQALFAASLTFAVQRWGVRITMLLEQLVNRWLPLGKGGQGRSEDSYGPSTPQPHPQPTSNYHPVLPTWNTSVNSSGVTVLTSSLCLSSQPRAQLKRSWCFCRRLETEAALDPCRKSRLSGLALAKGSERCLNTDATINYLAKGGYFTSIFYGCEREQGNLAGKYGWKANSELQKNEKALSFTTKYIM